MNAPTEAHVAREITAELASSETLVWSGQPRAGLRCTRADAFFIPFSVLWLAFVCTWTFRARALDAPVVFLMFGAMFIGFGLYFIAGRFFVDARRRRHTFYGLTSRRAVIVSGRRTRKVTSIQLRALAAVSLSERPDRSGSIVFGSNGNGRTWRTPLLPRSWPGMDRYLPPAFESIEEVRAVYERIGELRRRT
ncbi:MAG: hypothetical protein ACKVWV_11695 [Planctomycetota bacterium]